MKGRHFPDPSGLDFKDNHAPPCWGVVVRGYPSAMPKMDFDFSNMAPKPSPQPPLGGWILHPVQLFIQKGQTRPGEHKVQKRFQPGRSKVHFTAHQRHLFRGAAYEPCSGLAETAHEPRVHRGGLGLFE